MHLQSHAGSPNVTEGFACYWSFAAERQRMYYRRLAGCSGPLTEDPVLAGNRFTNAYRASDRVSQYLITQVQFGDEWDWLDTFVRTLVFKIFNRIATWEHIVQEIGEPDWAALRDGHVARALATIAGKKPVYSAAYIMPPPRSASGPKYLRHLELVRRMVLHGAPGDVQSARSMADAFLVLRQHESIGDFLAYQFVTDLNYSDHLTFSESEFAVPGPGAIRGLRKCFSNSGGLSDEELLRWTWDRQEDEFASRGLAWDGLWGRPLQLIDVQNLFCEVDKYTRVAFPELARYAPGTRIKQRYRREAAPMTAWFPPKWGINDLVDASGSLRPHRGGATPAPQPVSQLSLFKARSTNEPEFASI